MGNVNCCQTTEEHGNIDLNNNGEFNGEGLASGQN